MNLFAYVRTYLRAFVRNDEGQDLLEYALLVALIAIVCIIAITTTGTNVNDIFVRIGEELGDALPD
jgi:pilus assembly protein Flp/PilA